MPFYSAAHVAAGESLPDNSNHRVGPLLAYIFRLEDGAVFNAPMLFVLAQWYLHHRYRTGVETSAALPFLGLGFQVSGDLVPLEPASLSASGTSSARP